MTQSMNVLEEIRQRDLGIEGPLWFLARRLNEIKGRYYGIDSRPVLEAFGFKVLGLKDADDLFYDARPPEGWAKATKGDWTSITDEQGRERIRQLYKGMFPKTRTAFLNIT